MIRQKWESLSEKYDSRSFYNNKEVFSIFNSNKNSLYSLIFYEKFSNENEQIIIQLVSIIEMAIVYLGEINWLLKILSG